MPLPYKIEAVSESTVPMLDVSVNVDAATRVVSTSVYRKDCDAPQRACVTSDVPSAYLEAAVAHGTQRAVTHCSSTPTKQTEMETVVSRAATNLISPHTVAKTQSRVVDAGDESARRKAMTVPGVKVLVCVNDAASSDVIVETGVVFQHNSDYVCIKSGASYLTPVRWRLVRIAGAAAQNVEPWVREGHPNAWATRPGTLPEVLQPVRISAPWLGASFAQSVKQLSHDSSGGPRVTFSWSVRTLERLIRVGSVRIPDCHVCGVYAWKCSCGLVYVGVTGRPLAMRAVEHRRAVEAARDPRTRSAAVARSSALGVHISRLAPTERPKHDWGLPRLVVRETDMSVMRVIESLLVRALPPGTTANELDVERHECQHVLDLDGGWQPAMHRWLNRWPSKVFHDDAHSGSRAPPDAVSADATSTDAAVHGGGSRGAGASAGGSSAGGGGAGGATAGAGGSGIGGADASASADAGVRDHPLGECESEGEDTDNEPED